jgi:hypothetical protein
MINSIDVKRLQNVEEEIKLQGGVVLSVAGDVGADDFPRTIIDATIKYVPPFILGTTSRPSRCRKIGNLERSIT